MSIQPVNKAAEHLINSTPILERKKRKALNAFLIKNNKGEGGGEDRKKKKKKKQGEGVGRKDWAELYGCIKKFSNDQSL